MTKLTKVSVRMAHLDAARSIAGALENLVSPPPEAVSQFEDGTNGWRIEAYFSKPPELPALSTLLANTIGATAPPLEVEVVPDLNWVAISQAALPPVQAGRFVVHGSHDRKRIPHGPHAIEIEAGEAFGTAHHATTLGCLMAIDRATLLRAYRHILDLGCGSGVLAIAVARACPHADILASDSDPDAIAVAGRNAKANSVSARIAFVCATGLAHPWLRHGAPYDLLIANILAGPLLALAPGIAKSVCRGGTVVLSGLLTPEAPALVARYASVGFALEAHWRVAGWSTLRLRKRG